MLTEMARRAKTILSANSRCQTQDGVKKATVNKVTVRPGTKLSPGQHTEDNAHKPRGWVIDGATLLELAKKPSAKSAHPKAKKPAPTNYASATTPVTVGTYECMRGFYGGYPVTCKCTDRHIAAHQSS